MKIENEKIQVGDEVRVGMQLMIVDEITEFDTVIVIDQDGGELELTENEIDVVGSTRVKIVPLQLPTQKELDAMDTYSLVLTYEESMER
jgi:hypothetical protein|tara:strand:- start:462 stop:728 length:267 start_codon:yes stop_codon:yes gene_type:complete